MNADLREIVPQGLDGCHKGCKGFGINGRRSSHHPDKVALGSTDDGGLVGGVEVHDSIFSFDGPEDLHAPNRR